MTQEPEPAARISEVPTDRLAHNFVGTLIRAKGEINKWDAMAVHLITMLREEFAEDKAAAERAARAHERERCAAIAASYVSQERYHEGQSAPWAAREIAAAIRALPEETT